MPTRTLFVTQLYEASLADAPGLRRLQRRAGAGLRACWRPRTRAGRAWSRAHGYRGYTSYASLDDLPTRASVFGALKRQLDRHAAAFAEALALDLGRGRLRLDSLWVNVLAPARLTLGPHPHPQRHLGRGLCRHAAGRRRSAAGGPAPAADDGRAHPPRRRRRAAPHLRRDRTRARARSSCGRAGCATRRWRTARGADRVSISFNYGWR